MNKKEKRSIEASEWIGQGTGRLFRRDALPPSHEESWPSLWIKKYGDLDGFPMDDKTSINGVRQDGSHVYFTCTHCDCMNLIANEEMTVL